MGLGYGAVFEFTYTYMYIYVPFIFVPLPCPAEEDLEEPDGRTVALGRNDKFLYGFDRSQLSKEVLDAVEAAGRETRLAAYSRWVGKGNIIIFP